MLTKKNLVADDGSLNLEQALIIALLVLVAAATLVLLGNAIKDKYSSAAAEVNTVTVPSL